MTRYTTDQLDEWRRDGAIVLPAFFSADEIEACAAAMEALYGQHRPPPDQPAPARCDDDPANMANQFVHIDELPFHSNHQLNLIALHPALIALAQAALRTERVQLYQCHTWAKFAGATDYSQPHHCDFINHTLTVPSDDDRLRTINLVIYFTDVSDAHGAVHYVPRTISDPITGPLRPFAPDADLNSKLLTVERSGAGPKGSVFAYGIDVYHRGTNLTVPGSHRYTMTVSYKATGNEQIGWSGWPKSYTQPWDLIFDHATPEQLACLGVPLPGDPFWTATTLARAQQRRPNWDLRPYQAAMK